MEIIIVLILTNWFAQPVMELRNVQCVQAEGKSVVVMDIYMIVVCVMEEVHVMDVMEEDGFDKTS